MENTGNELDVAINGQGFFMISSDRLGDVLTRNGQFDVDSEMNLVLPGVGQVLDDSGSPITLENSAILIDQYGLISVDGEEVAQIGIYSVEDMDSLYNAGRGLFQSSEDPDLAVPGTYQVLQKYLEKSNVVMAAEMSRVMAGQNMYNACSQIVKMYDQLNESLVTQIGRVG